MKWTETKPIKPGLYWYKDVQNINFVEIDTYYNLRDKVENDSNSNVNADVLYAKFIDKTIHKVDNLNGYWSSEPIPLPKEDIYKFKPYDKVLVRDYETKPWYPTFFGGYTGNDDYPYRSTDLYRYRICIPYEGNEHLANKIL